MFTRIGAFGLKIKRDQDFKSQKAPPFFFLLAQTHPQPREQPQSTEVGSV
jgi:hypothetical protein